MVELEGRSQRVIEKMQEKGKVVTLSKEFSARFENDIAVAFEPVQKEFRQKEKVSRAYIAKVESTTAQV